MSFGFLIFSGYGIHYDNVDNFTVPPTTPTQPPTIRTTSPGETTTTEKICETVMGMNDPSFIPVRFIEVRNQQY